MWPHLVASYFAGAFALLSYLVRWRPHPQGMPRLARKAAREVSEKGGSVCEQGVWVAGFGGLVVEAPPSGHVAPGTQGSETGE
jgi:hypothetical protein